VPVAAVVRLWAPSADPRNPSGTSCGTVMIGNGWGGGVNAQTVSTGVMAKVQTWAVWVSARTLCLLS
jgi:hypothetical protein